MAYVAGDCVFEVKGTAPNGEIWSNSWGVTGAIDGAHKDDAATALHSFYNDIAGLLFTGVNAAVCLCHDRFSGVTTDHPFSDVAGTNINAQLPSQLAIRVSLKAGVQVRGGPFLTGFTTDILATGGFVDSANLATIVGEVEDLALQLDADGMALALDSPTNLAMFTVFEARVGERFDVIRSRANDILESYVSASI